MAYAHARFLFRRDGVPSDEHGSGGAPAGADPGTVGWNRPTGSRILCTDTGDTYIFDGTNWDQQLDVNSTFSDAADTYDDTTATVNAPAADDAVGVHAAYATGVDVNFPGAFTNPVVPRNVSCTFSGGYDGGDIQITGTDMLDVACVETIADVAGTTVYGTKVFKTVTAAVQQNLGGGGQTCSIGWGHKLGLLQKPEVATGVLTVDGVSEPCTVDNTAQSWGFIPTTVPDGAKNYRLQYVKAGATSTVTATP